MSMAFDTVRYVLPILLSGVNAVTPAVPAFLFPSGPDYSTTFTIGQAITITWNGAENFTSLSLGLRSTRTSNISWLIGNPESSVTTYYAATVYPWTITLPQTPAFAINESDPYGTSFDFWLVDGGYVTQIESTHFNITEAPAPKSITESSSTMTTLPTSTSITSDPSSQSQTNHPDLTGIASKSTKIGIGIGAPTAFLLAIAICWWCIRRKHRKEEERYDGPFADIGDIDVFAAPATQVYGMEGKTELPVPEEDMRLLKQDKSELHAESLRSRNQSVQKGTEKSSSLSSSVKGHDLDRITVNEEKATRAGMVDVAELA